MLVYVTGIAGSGKSAVRAELERRGYDARDVDDPGISGAYNSRTGKQVPVPDANVRPEGWFTENHWRMHPGALDSIRRHADSSMVFLCGTSTGDVEAGQVYDALICLDIDEGTLRRRIASRDDGNDFGKTDHELAQILEWRQCAAAHYASLGGTLIDSTASLDQVVDRIVAAVDADLFSR